MRFPPRRCGWCAHSPKYSYPPVQGPKTGTGTRGRGGEASYPGMDSLSNSWWADTMTVRGAAADSLWWVILVSVSPSSTPSSLPPIPSMSTVLAVIPTPENPCRPLASRKLGKSTEVRSRGVGKEQPAWNRGGRCTDTDSWIRSSEHPPTSPLPLGRFLATLPEAAGRFRQITTSPVRLKYSSLENEPRH